jgi:hypothetical protein
MKRILVTIAALLAVFTACADVAIVIPKDSTGAALTAKEIAASGTFTSVAIEPAVLIGTQRAQLKANGYFAAQITVTGSGTIKVEYLCSNDGVTYVEPEGASDIVSGMTAGTKYVAFQPPVSRYQKIKVTETGGASTATVTVILCIQ